MTTTDKKSRQREIIALIQLSNAPESRTYTFYDDVSQCMDGLCQLYEQAIAVKNPHLHNVTYSFDELLHYLQCLPDLRFLVREDHSSPNTDPLDFTTNYVLREMDWVERQMFHHLRRQANP